MGILAIPSLLFKVGWHHEGGYAEGLDFKGAMKRGRGTCGTFKALKGPLHEQQ